MRSKLVLFVDYETSIVSLNRNTMMTSKSNSKVHSNNYFPAYTGGEIDRPHLYAGTLDLRTQLQERLSDACVLNSPFIEAKSLCDPHSNVISVCIKKCYELLLDKHQIFVNPHTGQCSNIGTFFQRNFVSWIPIQIWSLPWKPSRFIVLLLPLWLPWQ